MESPLLFVVAGLLAFLLAWLDRGSGDKLRMRSLRYDGPIRPFLRREPGPVYADALAFEVWGAGLFVLGAIGLAQQVLIGSSDLPFEVWFVGGLMLVGVVFIGSLVFGLAKTWAARRRGE